MYTREVGWQDKLPDWLMVIHEANGGLHNAGFRYGEVVGELVTMMAPGGVLITLEDLEDGRWGRNGLRLDRDVNIPPYRVYVKDE